MPTPTSRALVTPIELGTHDGWAGSQHYKPEDVLQCVWGELAFDARPSRFREAFGIIDVLYAVGLLSEKENRDWKLRMLQECPGHYCGTRWCAYCGDIITEEEEEESDSSWTKESREEINAIAMEAGQYLRVKG